jgi:hypothetical protein
VEAAFELMTGLKGIPNATEPCQRDTTMYLEMLIDVIYLILSAYKPWVLGKRYGKQRLVPNG